MHGFIWRFPCYHTRVHNVLIRRTFYPGSPHRNHQDICNNLRNCQSRSLSVLFIHVLLYLLVHRIWYLWNVSSWTSYAWYSILIKPEDPHFLTALFWASSGVNWCNSSSLISQYQCFLAEWCCATDLCCHATFWLHSYIVIESRLDLTILFFFCCHHW